LSAVGFFFFFLPQMLKRRTSALLPITFAALRRADGFILSPQNRTAAWLCNWLKIYSAASLLQNRLLCVVVGAN